MWNKLWLGQLAFTLRLELRCRNLDGAEKSKVSWGTLMMYFATSKQLWLQDSGPVLWFNAS